MFAATCSHGSRSDLVDAAGGASAMGGRTSRSSQPSGMPCSNSLYPRQQSEAGVDWQPVDFRKSEVLILFDGSESTGIASGPGTRSKALADAVNTVVDDYQHRIAFGLLRFPDAAACGSDVLPGCCVGAPSVDLGLDQGAAIRAVLANQSAPQGSSPLTQALQTAANYFSSRPSQGESRLVLLATDGQPGCEAGSRDASVSSGACQEATRMVQALAKLVPPVQTLVLSPAPSDSSESAECLRTLGDAATGYQARDASIQSRTFTTDEVKSLEATLEKTFLPGQMAKPACYVVLDPVPLSNAFSVYVDGHMIPEDDNHGYKVVQFRGVTSDKLVVTVSLTGEYCTRLQQYRYDSVEVAYDCRITRLDRPNKGCRTYCKT
jgi:hypothetical protein